MELKGCKGTGLDDRQLVAVKRIRQQVRAICAYESWMHERVSLFDVDLAVL